MTTKRLSGRIALVTGASRGIGAAVARAFSAEGAHLVLVARSKDALEDRDDELRALGGGATLVPLDLRDGDGIDRMGAAVAERWGRLDILVGNAGVLGLLAPVGHIPIRTWQELLDVNLTANWRLIRAFDPLLRAADAGRAIFVTSGAARNPRAYWGGYAVTKAALETLAETYAAEVGRTAVRVNLLNPGATATDMRAQAMPGEDPASLPTADDVARLFVEMASPGWEANGDVVDYREWRERADASSGAYGLRPRR